MVGDEEKHHAPVCSVGLEEVEEEVAPVSTAWVLVAEEVDEYPADAPVQVILYPSIRGLLDSIKGIVAGVALKPKSQASPSNRWNTKPPPCFGNRKCRSTQPSGVTGVSAVEFSSGHKTATESGY